MAGVWTLEYTNGYRDSYSITADGQIQLQRKKTKSQLSASDNDDFPQTDGWLKNDHAHRYTTMLGISVDFSLIGFSH